MAADEPYEPTDRRPIASRELGASQAIARTLVRYGVAPNHISISSSIFAGLGGLAIVSAPQLGSLEGRLAWLAAALLIQLRLLANLFDGMVALQSGRASPVGELFNEVPDRVSDTLLLVALGYVPGSLPELGYVAALSAIFVAYLRAMGGIIGAGQVFAGVMAKPQRMAVLTGLCLFQAISPRSWQGPWWAELGVTGAVAALIIFGCGLTSLQRLYRITETLNRAQKGQSQ